MITPDIYISADIEADGPIPSDYSMLAVGLAIAGRYDGDVYEPMNPREQTFYRELQPITGRWESDALEISSLDREQLLTTGAIPGIAMQELADWVTEHASEHTPVLVGFPVVFDWMFIHWYLMRFLGASPFGHSHALDMKTMFQQKARVTVDRAGLNDLWPELQSTHPHTHNARDDAIEQAEVFSQLFNWSGPPNG